MCRVVLSNVSFYLGQEGQTLLIHFSCNTHNVHRGSEEPALSQFTGFYNTLYMLYLHICSFKWIFLKACGSDATK